MRLPRWDNRSFVQILIASLVVIIGSFATDTMGVSLRKSRPGKKIDILSHRGANRLAPENTPAAFRKAVELGADYIEVDVRTSADGVLMAIHDSTVDRTTDGTGRVRDLTAEQIGKLDAGSWFKPPFKGQRVPEVIPLVKWLNSKGAKVFFDVKDCDLPSFIKLVYELKLEKDAIFWCGDKKMALRFHELDPKLNLKINVSDIPTMHQAVKEFDARMVDIPITRWTPEFMKEARRLGLQVMVSGTGYNKQLFQRVLESGADIVVLDHLTLFMEFERQFKPQTSDSAKTP